MTFNHAKDWNIILSRVIKYTNFFSQSWQDVNGNIDSLDKMSYDWYKMHGNM